MAFTPARLVDPTVLGTSAADLYTATRSVLVKQVIVANKSGAAATVRLSLLPSGVSADAVHQLLPDVSVAANDSLVLDAFQVLAPGDKLNGLAGTGSALVVTISGVLL